MENPNLSYIQNLSGGDSDFEKKIIEIIKSEFPTEKQTYHESLQNGGFLKTAEIVHKLKHKISILGLTKSYDIAVDYEENLKEHKTDLKDEFEEILTNMSNFINKM